MDILVAVGATGICLLSAVFLLQLCGGGGAKRVVKPCGCACSCGNGEAGTRSVTVSMPLVNGEVSTAAAGTGAGRESAGGSMMEQLVPEITTHTLSYLDYPSLCRLSMTNSSMRRAANDDNAWKALYHKDFTVEQDNVTPPNGWKSYYAVTKTIINLNAEFYSIIRERSIVEMSRFWLQADYVKCIHPSGELFSGYGAVMDSWALAFNWPWPVFHVRDVRARALTDVAWVTLKVYVDADAGLLHATNVFELHGGRWLMVHHHCSALLGDDAAELGHQHLFG